MEKAQNPWSVPVVVDEIPETGLHLEVDAPEAVRKELAGLAGVRELFRLSGEFDLARKGARVSVTGRVKARVGQTCVVTLEPIESNLDEAVDLIFAPAAGDAVEAGAKNVKADDEPPEPLIDGKLDLGAVATEFLLLGIDPYPRKADAEFVPLDTDGGGAHPFAGLDALKKRLSGG